MKAGSVASAAYGNQDVIQERHRHRYEFNNKYRDELAAKGLVFSGTSPDNRLVEVVEIPENKFFVAAQYIIQNSYHVHNVQRSISSIY